MTPIVHIINYQQYIDASPLLEAILENMPDAAGNQIAEPLYASIAYITVNKTRQPRRLYETVLALSIRGKTYRYAYAHNQRSIYEAMNAIAANKYEGNMELKDTYIKLLQDTFEVLIFLRVSKIVSALLKAYNIKID